MEDEVEAVDVVGAAVGVVVVDAVELATKIDPLKPKTKLSIFKYFNWHRLKPTQQQ